MDHPDKTAIVVLGMHRAGTSSVAGTLVKLGATAPKTLMPASAANERGFFESLALMQLNDEILASASSSWHDWRAFDRAWYGGPASQILEPRAKATLQSEYDDANLIVVKDPRICRMAPFWFDALKSTGYSPRVLIPLRSPLEVATSLQTRYGFDYATGLLMWLRHTVDAEVASRNLPRDVIFWPDFLADWRAVVARASERINLAWPNPVDHSKTDIDQFLTPSLRHFSKTDHEFAAHPDVNEWVRLSYEAMITLSQDPSSRMALKTLDYVKLEFDNGSKIFGRALAAQGRFAKVEADAAAARAERDAMAHERDRLVTEIEQYRVRVDALVLGQAALAEQLATARILMATPNPAAIEPSEELSPSSLELEEKGSVTAGKPSEPTRRKKAASTSRDIDAAVDSARHSTKKRRWLIEGVDDQLDALQLQGESLRRNVETLKALSTPRRASPRKVDRNQEDIAQQQIHAKKSSC